MHKLAAVCMGVLLLSTGLLGPGASALATAQACMHHAPALATAPAACCCTPPPAKGSDQGDCCSVKQAAVTLQAQPPSSCGCHDVDVPLAVLPVAEWGIAPTRQSMDRVAPPVVGERQQRAPAPWQYRLAEPSIHARWCRYLI